MLEFQSLEAGVPGHNGRLSVAGLARAPPSKRAAIFLNYTFSCRFPNSTTAMHGSGQNIDVTVRSVSLVQSGRDKLERWGLSVRRLGFLHSLLLSVHPRSN